MKKIYLILFFLAFAGSAAAQTPCTLSLDSVYLDTILSNCSHLYFKYNVSGGTATSYSWTYGDGNSCTCIKPKNFYTSNGTYQVCGRIQDANGCADSLCISVIVSCSNPCDLSEIGIYSVDTLSYSCNEMEFITITSSNARKIRWDFGDGDSSDNKYEIHTYKQNGTYNVRLIIEDSIACSDTADLRVVIYCDEIIPCNLEIQGIDTLSQGDCYTRMLTLHSNKGLLKVNWDFGDGGSLVSNKSQLWHFADTGLFRVCAVAEDSAQCRDTFCRWVKISCPEQSGINQHTFAGLKIYPSPFSNYFNIEFDCNAGLLVLDCNMREVYKTEMEAGTNEIKISSLNSGLYFIIIETEEGRGIFKILKE